MVNMMYFFNKAFITSIYTHTHTHTHIYIYIYIHIYIYIYIYNGLGIVEVVGALELLKDLTG